MCSDKKNKHVRGDGVLFHFLFSLPHSIFFV
nr:MAG TPA: hypothetical protein [Microviridae sp.]